MKSGININQKDPKSCLLNKILKFIDTPKTIKILSINSVHNTTIFMDCLKLKKIVIQKISNWKYLKIVRGLIEDFFKVAKDTLDYEHSTNIQPNQ